MTVVPEGISRDAGIKADYGPESTADSIPTKDSGSISVFPALFRGAARGRGARGGG